MIEEHPLVRECEEYYWRLYRMPGKSTSCTKVPVKNEQGKIICYASKEAILRDYEDFGKPSSRLFAGKIHRLTSKHVLVDA